MSKEFSKLIELEHGHVIAIGLNRNHANNFWYRTTTIGKVLNYLTILLALFTIFIFIKAGVIQGILFVLLTGVYVITVQKMAVWHAKLRFLREEGLFKAAYNACSATLRDNRNGEISCFPTDWQTWIQNR